MRIEWPISTQGQIDALLRAEAELQDVYPIETIWEGHAPRVLENINGSTSATRVWIIGG